MAFLNAWNETTPAGGDNASTTDDFLRKHRLDLGERLEEMFYGFNTSDNSGAENLVGIKLLKCFKQASDPTQVTDYAHLYVKLVSGVPELFFQDDTNTTFQITTAGALNVLSADLLGKLANNTYFTAVDNAGTGTVDLIKGDAGDRVVIFHTTGKRAILASDVPPNTDAGIANKKYVDDEVAVNAEQANASNSITRTSSSYADMANMSITISSLVSGQKVLVMFSMSSSHTQQGQIANVQLLEASNVLTVRLLEAGIDGKSCQGGTMQYIFTATGTSHTFKVQWKTGGATFTVTNRTLNGMKI